MIIDINGKNFEFFQGETIIQVAERNGIEIPKLCYDKRFKPYTSCFVCIVRDKNLNKLIPSCSARAVEGMSIITDDEEIRKLRKMALELLLSEHDADCFSPCKTKCPANLDVRDYILYVRTENNFEGFLSMRKRNPLLTSTGRVCPAFCEEDCSRVHIDEKVDIRLLKRYLADTIYKEHDKELFEYEKTKIRKNYSKTKVAIVGGGPAGLASAYHLSLAGYNVKIFEFNKELGGMLRYAIPCYRLPVLDLNKEIESIIRLGVEVETNIKVDKRLLNKLSKVYDAVIVSTGTWKESGLRLGEEKFLNIIPAISFLRSIVIGDITELGKQVIVVGGGNSAIDAARVSIRKGAKVKLLYRRTRAQMPALNIEIEDALHEGMELYELMSPLEIVPSSKEGLAKALKFQKMELSFELDESGRNKIISTNDFETFEFDKLVFATGQKPEQELIDAIKEYNLKNVHLCGDALNGATTVIEAVANARKISYGLIKRLDGTDEYIPNNEMEFYSQREAKRLVENDFKKLSKIDVKHLDPKIRSKNFEEVELGHSNKTAKIEAERCINCGCKVVDDCDLRSYSIEYGADPLRYKEGKLTGLNVTYLDKSNKDLIHEPSKCIKCGKCISVCNEVAGAFALSFIGRGANVVLSSNTKNNIGSSSCILCGMCIDSCPTGSLIEKLETNVIWSGIKEEISTCEGCVANCEIKFGFQEKEKIRARSHSMPICSVGRWGWKYFYKEHEKYYKGKIINSKTSFDVTRLADINVLKNSDYVLSISYNPSGDNPSIFAAFKSLIAKKVQIETIYDDLKIPDLSKYNKPVIVFNYLNFDETLTNKVLNKFTKAKILPVYYKKV